MNSAQGKEKDIVLISCVRSGRTIEFLRDQHRLNAMLTKARRALYIFGNLTMLAEQDPHWNALIENVENRQVIDKCEGITFFQLRLDAVYIIPTCKYKAISRSVDDRKKGKRKKRRKNLNKLLFKNKKIKSNRSAQRIFSTFQGDCTFFQYNSGTISLGEKNKLFCFFTYP